MKVSKKWTIAIAASAVVAGLTSFLLGTEKGKSLTQKWRRRSGEIATKAKDVIKEEKGKLASMKQEVLDRSKKDEKITRPPSEVSA